MLPLCWVVPTKFISNVDKSTNELGQQKVRNLLNTGAAVIASPNPGCSLQIKKHLQLQGKDTPVIHPIELLDYAIRGLKIG